MSQTSASERRQDQEPVAIVGIGLRFPGGSVTADEFAEFLQEGRSGIRSIPEDRWDVAAFSSDDESEKGKIRATGGGFLDRIDEFDATFFNISPKEAQYTDPQQRMLLEVSWEALEHANIDPTALRDGNGGVYVGASSIDYALELDNLPAEELDGHLAAGVTFFPMSGRLSYFLGWRGPCMTIDTACASSLTALHQAVVGLRRGECHIALCAGVNALHHPRTSVIFSHANMLAPDAKCKTFDDAANGYVRAEGCGAIVLKRLADARRDGDTVLAVVAGSAVGQDGNSAGLSVPNGSAQEQIIRAALADADLEPADIQYVEAHGTGTPLGDPIEMGAINEVFAKSHTKDNPLVVGSVKTNVGHLEPVAGIVGVVKTVLQMRQGVIYPHVNFTTPSGRIPWDRYPVTVPVTCQPWTASSRRAVVNSFGFGGTIAVAVLEQPAEDTVGSIASQMDGGHVFTLSAKNKRSLRRQVERYRSYLADHPDADPGDLCYTSNVGRAHFKLRLAGVVDNREQLGELLDRQAARLDDGGTDSNDVRKVAFLFSGQGSQYPGMGSALYRQFPVFRHWVDECDRLFANHLSRSVREIAFGETEQPEDLNQTLYTQTALFTVEYALAQLWLSWGVRPNVMVGHSIGEVVAATVAGLFTLEDAVTLVAARARLMQSVSTRGGMAAVPAPVSDVAPLLADHPGLAIAAINSPGQCVISGAEDSLNAVVDLLTERGLEVKRLAVSHAFHSPLMAEVFTEFREAIKDIQFHEPTLTLISNLTGQLAKPAEISTPDYWVRHIGEPVNFEAGMRAVERRGQHTFVEIGPSTALMGLAKKCVATADHRWANSLHRTDEDGVSIRRALVALYTAGVAVRWAEVHSGRARRKVTLPSYGFDRKRYWLPISGTPVAGKSTHHPLLGTEISTPEQLAAGVREFRAQISPQHPAYLADHVLMGQVVFPGAGYLEMLLALQDAVWGETGRPLTDVRISEPLLLDAERATDIRIRLTHHADDTGTVRILSRAEGTGEVVERSHVTATVAAAPTDGPLDKVSHDLRARAAAAADPEDVRRTDDLYRDFAAVGLDYGPEFQRMRSITRYAADFAVGDLQGRHTTGMEHLPPTILDGALHTLAVLVDDGHNYLPVRFGELRLFKKPKSENLRVLLRLGEAEDKAEVDLSADLLVLEGERPVVELRGLGLKRVADTAAGRRGFLHQPTWVKRSQLAPPLEQPRHVLLLHRTEADVAALAAEAAEAGVVLSFAATTDEAVAVLGARPITDVVWFWENGAGPITETALRAECEGNYRDLLDLLARLEGAGFGHNQRLWLVTERAQWLPGDTVDEQARPAAATLWGFGHVLLNERPAYRVTMVDLGGGGDTQLLTEWRTPDSGEYQVAFRHGHRYVRRLLPARPARQEEEENSALTIGEYGRFANIRLAPTDDVAPVEDQVQVQVHAAGINFKDVLNALGMLKEHADSLGVEYQPQPLGFECSGTVVAAGPTAEFEVGAEVIVNHAGLMRRRVTVPSSAAVRKPARVSPADAAGLATAYVTAYYSLHHLARIKKGDRVLIHAAAGGVGQAAVQLAKAAGAEVFATASPHKWPVLRAQGVRHVMNSRTLDFADQIERETDGVGVDIVLNSLNKDYIPAGLRTLAERGRFVELGKVGVWTPEQVAQARHDVEYHNFDLSELPEDMVARLNKEILTTVVDQIGDGRLDPIPTTVYSLDEVEEAFGVLSRGANVGKLVIDFGVQDAPEPREITIRPDRTYLITGGLGAFGLVTAEKLVSLGARHLAIVSRQSVPPPDASHLLDRLGDRAEVTLYQGDIGNAEHVRRITKELAASPRPVGGVIHAAGRLADAPVSAQTWENIDQLFEAKVYGTWLLHEATESFQHLEFFVAYSSAASVVGGASQSNYAAANSFVDNVIHRRVRGGLPGLSINWGPMSEVGMSARLSAQHVAALEHEGVRFFSPAKAMRALFSLLGGSMVQVAAGECDWDRFVTAKPVVNALYQELTRDSVEAADSVDLEALLALPSDQRLAPIDQFIRGAVAKVLHVTDLEDLDSDTEFTQMGLDSLAGVELKNALEAALRISLPASVAFDHPTAKNLAEFIDRQLTPASAA
jgi:acyl transferase domain-containing protein/NAD(P)-dependent dehydrogenase (short-subunit alcohol dehydrogenase family)/acyl carrier protein